MSEVVYAKKTVCFCSRWRGGTSILAGPNVFECHIGSHHTRRIRQVTAGILDDLCCEWVGRGGHCLRCTRMLAAIACMRQEESTWTLNGVMANHTV